MLQGRLPRWRNVGRAPCSPLHHRLYRAVGGCAEPLSSAGTKAAPPLHPGLCLSQGAGKQFGDWHLPKMAAAGAHLKTCWHRNWAGRA